MKDVSIWLGPTPPPHARAAPAAWATRSASPTYTFNILGVAFTVCHLGHPRAVSWPRVQHYQHPATSSSRCVCHSPIGPLTLPRAISWPHVQYTFSITNTPPLSSPFQF